MEEKPWCPWLHCAFSIPSSLMCPPPAPCFPPHLIPQLEGKSEADECVLSHSHINPVTSPRRDSQIPSDSTWYRVSAHSPHLAFSSPSLLEPLAFYPGPKPKTWILPHPRPAHTLSILGTVQFPSLSGLSAGPAQRPQTAQSRWTWPQTLSVRGTVPKCKHDPAVLPRSSRCLWLRLPITSHTTE